MPRLRYYCQGSVEAWGSGHPGHKPLPLLARFREDRRSGRRPTPGVDNDWRVCTRHFVGEPTKERNNTFVVSLASGHREVWRRGLVRSEDWRSFVNVQSRGLGDYCPSLRSNPDWQRYIVKTAPRGPFSGRKHSCRFIRGKVSPVTGKEAMPIV